GIEYYRRNVRGLSRSLSSFHPCEKAPGMLRRSMLPDISCSGEKEKIAMHIRLHSLGTVAGVLAAVALGGCASSVDSSEEDLGLSASAAVGELGLRGAPEHVQFMKGEARPSGGGSSPLMTWHGGTVLT